MSYNPIMMDPREQQILDYIREQGACSSGEIHNQAGVSV